MSKDSSFDTEWDEQLDKVWVIETVHQETNKSVVGGAICIGAEGLLATVAHLLHINDIPLEKLQPTGRGYKDLHFRKLEVVKVYETFDLALVRVKDKRDDEEFSYVSLENEANVSVSRNEQGLSHVHSGRLPFSSKLGYVCYPFSDNGQLRNIYQEIICNPNLILREKNGDESSNKVGRVFEDYSEYRKLSSCVDKSDEALNLLHCDLPLIQLQGFGNTAGMFGCPVFKRSNGQMIGLFSFANQQSQFIIPTGFLHCIVQKWREQA